MKRFIRKSEEIFGMANITPKKSGLSVDIWSDHKGCNRSVSHRCTPRVKVSTSNGSVSVTIEDNPVIKAKSGKLKNSDMRNIQDAMNYIGRNSDLFLKHYNDTEDEFDDEDLFNALREREEYK